MPGLSAFSSDVTLSRAAVLRKAGKFIADLVMPILGVEDQTAKVAHLDPTSRASRNINTHRAFGQPANVFDFDISRPVSYKITDHAQKTAVPIETNASPIQALKLMTTYSGLLVEVLKTSREIEVKAVIDAALTGSLTSTVVALPGGGGIKWNAAGTTPIKDIMIAMEIVRIQSGTEPNTLVLNKTVLNAIAQSAEFKEYVKFTQIQTINAVAAMISSICGIATVIVATNTSYNTAAFDATPVRADIWGDDVYLTYIEPPEMLTSNPFMGIRWDNPDLGPESTGGIVDGWRVITWFDPDAGANMIRVARYYDNIANYVAGDTLCPAYRLSDAL